MERIELHTQRLLLRPWRFSDVEDAFSYGRDEEWGRYLWNTPSPYLHRHAEQFIASCVLDSWERQAQFAIEFGGHVIGGVRLYIIDDAAGVAGMGYNVAPTHWGQGIATEAAQAVLKHAFYGLGLGKIFSTTDSRNLASIRVLEKLGATREGLLRRHRLHRGEYIDEACYGILASDVTR